MPDSELDDVNIEWHEKIAKDCFNKTWDLIDKENRNTNEDNQMVHTAHTSRYHWGVLVANKKGEPLNIQRGEWLITHVYTLLKRKEPALHHAKICLKITKNHNIGGFDAAFAYEAMARAYASAGDKNNFEKFFKLAEKASEGIDEKEDKEYFEGELEKGEWFNLK